MTVNEGYLLRFFLIFGVLSGAQSHSAAPDPAFTVVIDPGHGGSDYGASHREKDQLFYEKDLTLLLGQEIARTLRLRGVNTVLTRKDDREVSLEDRTALANRMGAKVFISIHMNSSLGLKKGEPTGGIETYILNNSTHQTSKRLADLENSVLKGSIADHLSQQGVKLIVKDMILDANLAESKHLACLVQEGVVKSTKTSAKKNRGVKQALFLVLLAADMPSILVEAGFINNSKDRNQVLERKSREKISLALATAIERYRKTRGTHSAQLTLSKCPVF